MAAIKAVETLSAAGVRNPGDRLVLYDKNPVLGRKIYLTGRGRCNITNTRPWEEFSQHIYPNKSFLKHAFNAFSNEDVMRFFEDAGVPVTVLQGQRVFPVSQKAADVARALERRVHECGIDVRTESVTEEMFERLLDDGLVILATGGKSYPVTGSTGDGYQMASRLGHSITRLFPSETALTPQNYDHLLEGLEMKNVGLRLFVDKDQVQQVEGDFNFTDDGLESGIAYKVSRRAVWALINGQKVELVLDLKPALSLELLKARVARDLESSKLRPGALLSNSRWAQTFLRGFMPEQMIRPFINSNPGLDLDNLASRLKEWHFRISSYKGYERAVVTAGGVSLKEVSQKTMESKIRPGLFLAGEVLDLDGDTGGYNLQTAFSTGALAGCSAARKLLTFFPEA